MGDGITYNRHEVSPFTPIQPALEKLTTYCHYAVNVDHPLYGIVSVFYEFIPNKEDTFNIVAVPDGCLDIIFQFYHDCVKGFIYGCITELLTIDWSECNRCFGFRLYPGAVGNLLRCSAKELTHNYTQVVYNITYYDELFEKIPKSNSFEERINLVEHFFKNRIAKDYQTPVPVLYAVNKIIDSYGNVTIKDLCKETGYSLSYFHKMFDRYIGVSPKTFAEIVRFQHSLILLYSEDNLSLAEISYQCGYYDQARMNRAYKNFVGYPPSEFRKIILNQQRTKSYSLL